MVMSKRSLWLFLGGLLIAAASGAVAQTTSSFPGGWVEKDGTAIRTRLAASQIQSFVPPARGSFTFPSPYNTKAVRITDASDCGGLDCLWYVGYSYWRNSNAHQNSNEMLMFLGLASNRGGSGPTLFSYNKSTDVVTKVGPLFPTTSKYRDYTAEGWYWSASRQNTLYLYDGPKMLRYDVVTKQFETVFDVTAQFGTDRRIWQMHSSNDDLVHTATLRVASTSEMMGCLVYLESTKTFRWYPKIGVFDECHVDKSGRWTVSLEDIGVPNDIAMRIFDNQSGKETRISGPNSTLGHFDTGFGYAVGADNHNGMPNASILWTFSPTMAPGPVVHYNTNWNIAAAQHISHANAKFDLPFSQQIACGSDASTNYSVQNEIICFRMDNSDEQLVVAPVMTDPNASGGCCDFFSRQPKGNLDITGSYFIWTTNLGGNRMDAFLVKVPSHLLVAGSDNTPPPAPVNLRFQ
jgi:hypothetical protein